jgi:hypothetical protein
MLSPTRRVILNIAETPRWQPVTAISGSARTTSTTFRIQGSRWRVVYRMNFVGTCTFILFCSGPSAAVDNLASGGAGGGFGLSDGGPQTQEFSTGPGTFRLRISPGSDQSRWSAWVEDWY